MAEESARPARGQKKATGDADAPAASGRNKAAPKPKRAAAKAKATPTGRKLRAVVVAEPTREAIAERAYLLWEQGEPGDETTHWLLAEDELRAA
jgi:Protein of unknown function (DUF2934)